MYENCVTPLFHFDHLPTQSCQNLRFGYRLSNLPKYLHIIGVLAITESFVLANPNKLMYFFTLSPFGNLNFEISKVNIL